MKGSLNAKVLIAIAILAILVVGGFLMLNKPAKKDEVADKAQPASSAKENVFTSIKDALSKSLSLQCEYTQENGTKTVAYIKNGAIRGEVTGSTPDATGSIIVKDKRMYFWNEKSAFMMELPDVETPAQTGSTKASTGTNLLNTMEQYKDHCKPAAVSDSLFTPPADKTFTDMSKLVPSGLPKNSGSGVNQEEINKMMQQYKITPPANQ